MRIGGVGYERATTVIVFQRDERSAPYGSTFGGRHCRNSLVDWGPVDEESVPEPQVNRIPETAPSYHVVIKRPGPAIGPGSKVFFQDRAFPGAWVLILLVFDLDGHPFEPDDWFVLLKHDRPTGVLVRRGLELLVRRTELLVHAPIGFLALLAAVDLAPTLCTPLGGGFAAHDAVRAIGGIAHICFALLGAMMRLWSL